MGWQTEFFLSERAKGCHLITDEILAHVQPGLHGVQIGVLFLFIKHTSAALTLNENWDKDVRRDMDMALDSIVPESLSWRHTDEGPDDSVSHTKTSLLGNTVSIPITDGKLNLGTWQGEGPDPEDQRWKKLIETDAIQKGGGDDIVVEEHGVEYDV